MYKLTAHKYNKNMVLVSEYIRMFKDYNETQKEIIKIMPNYDHFFIYKDNEVVYSNIKRSH